ncbi:uncharacterized protein LOC135172648 [Diachasmimorpha longicaudata]|uniref:uncharacterized protein LOC135172648 n=1 Tax=Diachasmimorpha longicaudata TaxID=58733 RepID=UPI0030B8C51A
MENGNNEPSYDNGIWKGVVTQPTKWYRYRSELLESLRKFPDRIVQIDHITNRKDSYRELADRVVRCAIWLKRQNLKPDDVIGICTYNHLDTFVPVLAIILTGHIMNPWWNAVLDNDLAKYFLNLTQPKIVFADDVTIDIIKEAVAEVGSTAKVIAFRETPGFESLDNILMSPSASEVAEFRPNDLQDIDEPFWIAYTSGSTGYPKGAVISYRRIIVDVGSIPEEPSINFWVPAICWTTGVVNMLITITRCSSAIICPGATEEIIAQILDKYKVTHMLMSNAAIASRMMKVESIKEYDFSFVKMVMFGGVALLPEVDKFLMNLFPNALISNAYGSTEAAFICMRRKKMRKLTSCGQVTPNCEIKIVDPESGNILGPNEEGELYAKHAGMMLRYYKDEQNTKAAFDEEGWFRTGDLAYYDEDGDYFIVDRLKELIKFKNNIHIVPAVIEGIILTHPGVFEVAVVAKPHVSDAEHPMAFVIKHPNAKVTEHDIIDLVAENLPDHMALRGGVMFLKEMPHTDAGKISKKELRRMARSAASEQ